MSVLRKRKVKLYCGRCHDRCDSDEYKTCEGCLRGFHDKCLLKSKKYTKTSLKNTQLFFCSKKCECSIFPFTLTRDKEFMKINVNVIKEPCSICGGECHKFDRIQCDECDKWVHLSCTSLRHEEFVKLGESSKPFFL